MDNDTDLVLDISIAKLEAEWCCNPFEVVVWSELDRPITREEITVAIQQNRLAAKPYCSGCSREYHVERIAYFVVNGWTDPIEMDLGCPSFGFLNYWPIQDGNHRFAASIYQDSKTVRASLSGELNWIRFFQA